ncbi:MAG: DUF3857 domain-containing protein, partial [Chitinophagaceae bacterium]|nr:DUF3857 domain-containing protein [Chitinophagaceae bacterium]
TGTESLTFNEFGDKSTSIDEVEIKMFDENGKLVNKVKKKDIFKQADQSGLVGEGYYYLHTMKPASYPVTIEYNYQISFYGTLNYPDYNIVGFNESVQSSSFIAKVPISLDLRFKEHEIKLKPEISAEGTYKKYKWTVNNMPAIKYEPGSVRSDYYFPRIILAPNKFKIYNTTGEMTSWNALGQWRQSLYNGLDELPAERKAFFANLVKDAPDERTKIELVYNYLQKNFRYVSIQLGIGGWKPFPAKFTDEKKYGDCKALSFYMYSVLKSLGIKSYVASINAGSNMPPVDPGFPINAFNHLILCVPQKHDSIWLECTSQTTDFNYLSNFTENRNALLVTENGGVLVPTPVSDPRKNSLVTFTNIYLDPSAFGRTTTKFFCNGEFRESMQELSMAKIDDQKEAIVYAYGFKQPDEFKFTKIADQEFNL